MFKRDDYTAFPYGCSAANLYPGFCANGDYDVYDYRSLGESKKPLSAQAMLQGKFTTGSLRHDFTAGVSHLPPQGSRRPLCIRLGRHQQYLPSRHCRPVR